MVQYLFEQDIIIYIMAGLCGLGLLIRLIVNMVHKSLVKETDKMGNTRNKFLKHMKMKFETCYKLKIGVNNVDTFVDKNLLRYKFSGILLSTWENFCGQVLFLSLLLVPISTVFGVVYNCEQELILSTGAIGILASSILIIVDKSINLQAKKRIARYNLLDYLENFCKVRLEQQTFHPELLEQYRKEYFDILGTEMEGKIASSPMAKKEDPKEELNRRREARRRKEEEKRAFALKREEEQKRLEAIRREEERRRIEERRILAAKRREEERLKMEEERQALEARRLEAKRKAELRTNSGFQNQAEGKDTLHSEEKPVSTVQDIRDMNIMLPALEELAAEKEHLQPQKEGKDVINKKAPSKAKRMSPEEEKLVEDVLKQFFA